MDQGLRPPGHWGDLNAERLISLPRPAARAVPLPSLRPLALQAPLIAAGGSNPPIHSLATGVSTWRSSSWNGSDHHHSKKEGPIVKRAIITGLTGRDGSYFAELLLHMEYEV